MSASEHEADMTAHVPFHGISLPPSHRFKESDSSCQLDKVSAAYDCPQIGYSAAGNSQTQSL
jgi:hypothetical protein